MGAMPNEQRSSPLVKRRRWVVLAGVAAAGVVVGVIAVALAEEDGPSRQEVVAERGASVMPFDLEATSHVFHPTRTGGVQTVVADDRADRDQVTRVRAHLREEAKRFHEGDFGDPAAIHGHDMPGLDVLEEAGGALEITYRDVTGGAELTFRSEDPTVVAALHNWFEAQLSDHGEHARPR